MRVRYSPIALLSLPALSIAVSLSDFPPAIQNLPSACGALYQQTISGCSSSDFTSKTGCSKSCIDALSAMTGPVQSSCANHNLGGENIIVAFLANSGPESICGNANAVLASESASSTPTSASAASSAAPATTSATSAPPSTTSSLESTTSTTSVSSTSELSSSTVADTTSSAIAAATTSTSTVSSTTASSSDAASTSAPSSTSSVESSTTIVPVAGMSSTSVSSSTSSSLNMDTSSPPATSATGSATSTTSSKSNMQTNYNDGSGGGSPFDSAGNMAQSAGSRLSASAFGYAVTVAFAACALALLR